MYYLLILVAFRDAPYEAGSTALAHPCCARAVLRACPDYIVSPRTVPRWLLVCSSSIRRSPCSTRWHRQSSSFPCSWAASCSTAAALRAPRPSRASPSPWPSPLSLLLSSGFAMVACGHILSYFLGKKSYIDKLRDEKGNVGYHIRMKGMPGRCLDAKVKGEYDGLMVIL